MTAPNHPVPPPSRVTPGHVDEPLTDSRAAKGAAGELLVAAHFMRRGYHVFRSESPSCPFDLMVYKDGVSYRAEVKSSSPSPALANGLSVPSFATPKNLEWDLLCIVYDGCDVHVYSSSMSLDEIKKQFRADRGLPPASVMAVRICSECANPHFASSYCRFHYVQIYGNGMNNGFPSAEAVS